jgi:hypothetical protein
MFLAKEKKLEKLLPGEDVGLRKILFGRRGKMRLLH